MITFAVGLAAFVAGVAFGAAFRAQQSVDLSEELAAAAAAERIRALVRAGEAHMDAFIQQRAGAEPR